jgi:hypothetical protein
LLTSQPGYNNIFSSFLTFSSFFNYLGLRNPGFASRSTLERPSSTVSSAN